MSATAVQVGVGATLVGVGLVTVPRELPAGHGLSPAATAPGGSGRG